jgi:excisionase family DNA binding protein
VAAKNQKGVSASAEPQPSTSTQSERRRAQADTYALYLRRAEAARLLSVSLGTLDTWLRRRVLPHIRVGGRVVLIRRADIDVALARFCVKAVES